MADEMVCQDGHLWQPQAGDFEPGQQIRRNGKTRSLSSARPSRTRLPILPSAGWLRQSLTA
jgi:hypothetical protein